MRSRDNYIPYLGVFTAAASSGQLIESLIPHPFPWLRLGGGISACLAMIIFYRPLGKLSPVGVSVLGAVSHSLTQLFIVYFFIVKHYAILYIAPFVIFSAVVTGVINAMIILKVIPGIAPYS